MMPIDHPDMMNSTITTIFARHAHLFPDRDRVPADAGVFLEHHRGQRRYVAQNKGCEVCEKHGVGFPPQNSESWMLLKPLKPTRWKFCGQRPVFRVFTMRAAAYSNLIGGPAGSASLDAASQKH